MSTSQPRILVTGASGNFGSLVLKYLTDTYHYRPSQIIATSRNPEKLSQWADKGVEVRKADFADPSTLVEAFNGADKVLFVSTDSAVDDVRLQQHNAAVAALEEAGVPSVIYTSMPEPDISAVSFAHVHLSTENAIKQSVKNWTILRNAWYFENLLFTIPGAVASGTLYSAAGKGAISYISRSDLARAAAAVLVAESGYENETLTVTGAEALTSEVIVEHVSEQLGKSISVVQVSTEAIIQGAVSHGLPQIVGELFASFDAATLAGHLGVITSDYQRTVGEKPQAFVEWLKENASLFIPRA